MTTITRRAFLRGMCSTAGAVCAGPLLLPKKLATGGVVNMEKLRAMSPVDTGFLKRRFSMPTPIIHDSHDDEKDRLSWFEQTVQKSQEDWPEIDRAIVKMGREMLSRYLA